MAESPAWVAATVLLASFLLQACVNTSLSTEAPQANHSQAEQRSPDASPSAQQELGVEAPSVSPADTGTRQLQFSVEAATAKLQRAHALELEASRLFSEAERIQEQANSSYAFGPVGSLVGPGNIIFLSEIAAKRARADQLSSEASQLRRQVDEEIARVRSATGVSLNDIRQGPGLNNDVSNFVRNPSAILGGPNSAAGGGCIRLFGSGCIRLPSIPSAGVVAGTNPDVGGGGDGTRHSTSAQHPSKTRPPSASIPRNKSGGSRHSSAASASQAPASSPAASFAFESGKIDDLVHGSAAVSAPSSAVAGDSFPVYLRVSPDKLSSVMQSLKNEFPENQTVKGKEGIKLTPRMVATVSGFGFEVSPKDGQAQAVSVSETTTWVWQVKALESGLQTLTFTLSGTLSIEGREVGRNFYQYQQKVQVEISPMGFVARYWQWLVTTLAIPAIGALWAMLRRPKDPMGKRQPSLAEKLRERRRLRTAA